MSNKFKYILFADQTYIVKFNDLDGNLYTIEIEGKEIIHKIRRQYILDKVLESIDNKEDLE